MAVYYRSVTTLGLGHLRFGRALTSRMIHTLKIFWHSTNRIGRTGFIAGTAALLAARAATDLAYLYGMPAWLVVILVLALGYSAMCVLSLRLHDRGRSGWWGWVILALFSLSWPLTRGVAFDVTQTVSTLLLILVFVDLALMPGQKGLNRHGPRPSR